LSPRARLVLVVICAGLIAWLSIGVRQTFGLFMQPISLDVGWGREVFAFALALQNLMWGLAQPFAGAFADRYGSGRVVVIGSLIYALGVYLMAETSGAWQMHLGAGFLIGFGLSATSFAVVLAAVGRVVSPDRRSLAFGFTTAIGSFGQFAMVPLGQSFLEAHGWSTALLLLAACSLVMMPLAAGLARDRAESVVPERIAQNVGAALREAAGHTGYRYLTVGFFVCGFQVSFIAVHLPAYLVDAGIDPSIGAWALSLVGLFNVVGSLLCGYLGGRYSKKNVLSMLYLGRALVITVFLIVPVSVTSTLLFASVMGVLWLGTVPLTSGLVAQIFGMRHMGTLFGVVFLSHQLGSFVGVWLGGYLYDATGTYDVVWWIAIALGVAAAILHWPIDERSVDRSIPATVVEQA